jgi:hypothetical protein
MNQSAKTYLPRLDAVSRALDATFDEIAMRGERAFSDAEVTNWSQAVKEAGDKLAKIAADIGSPGWPSRSATRRALVAAQQLDVAASGLLATVRQFRAKLLSAAGLRLGEPSGANDVKETLLRRAALGGFCAGIDTALVSIEDAQDKLAGL